MYKYKYVVRDKKKRYLNFKLQFYILKFKYVLMSKTIDVFYKYNFYFKFLCLLQDRKFVFKNRCGLTFRGRWPIRYVKMSRLKFKELGSLVYFQEYEDQCDNFV